MASCIMAPSHYLIQCGLIIELINKVLWHLSQWIIMKDLQPISKTRLKLICWDNFNPSPEIVHLFSSDNSFVCAMVVSWYLLSQSLIPVFYLLKGSKVPSPWSFVTTPQGGNVPRTSKTKLLHEESVTWKIMTSSVKAKIWKWLVNY